MGPDTFVFLIPITAIVLGIGSSIVKSILQSQERRLEMRLQNQQGQNDAVVQQLAALRAEVAGLRDTSTQFDLSLENSMQRLEERVSRLEIKAAVPSVTPQPDAPRQTVGRR
ncbi:MAG: hypothetical protein JO250_08730 [Armatimonadetes bacterium]|nr:hypothetical protein [Armatimonadota bacterium]